MRTRTDWKRRAGGVIGALALAMVSAVVPAQPAVAVPVFPGIQYYSAFAWGNNGQGQLGDGTLTNRLSAVQVRGLPNNISQVAGGGHHSLALTSTGTVWAWGYNHYGQLGDGTTAPWAGPRQVAGLSGVIQIAAAGTHSMALKSDGTVWAWGDNYYGQLGDGTTTDRYYPVRVVGLTGVTQIAAGAMHAIALRSNGTVWAWGYNYYGQLGDGTFDSRTYAAPASRIGGPVAQIATGLHHNVAVLTDGTVRTWGSNSTGQLGNGTTGRGSAYGVDAGLTNITQVAAGTQHTLATDGTTIYAWGANSGGQLGDGTDTWRTRPVRVFGSNTVLQLAGGISHSAALIIHYGERMVITWGQNEFGQLGDGTTVPRFTRVEARGLRGATKISAGYFHTLAVKPTQPVVCCG